LVERVGERQLLRAELSQDMTDQFGSQAVSQLEFFIVASVRPRRTRCPHRGLGELSALDQQFCEVISLTQLGRITGRYEWCGAGRPPCPRVWPAHAFIAKHVYQFPTTSALLEALRTRSTLRRLCGWESAGDIPSEPTFSRRLGHVPIIVPHPCGGEKIPLAPAEAQPFKERSASERINRLLKNGMADGGCGCGAPATVSAPKRRMFAVYSVVSCCFFLGRRDGLPLC
jgi:hypothetical protein